MPKAVTIEIVELRYKYTVHYSPQMSLQYGSFHIDCSLWVRVIGRCTVQLLPLVDQRRGLVVRVSDY